MNKRKVRSVRVARSLDFLNLTDVVRDIEDFVDKLDYANDIKKMETRKKLKLLLIRHENI